MKNIITNLNLNKHFLYLLNQYLTINKDLEDIIFDLEITKIDIDDLKENFDNIILDKQTIYMLNAEKKDIQENFSQEKIKKIFENFITINSNNLISLKISSEQLKVLIDNQNELINNSKDLNETDLRKSAEKELKRLLKIAENHQF